MSIPGVQIEGADPVEEEHVESQQHAEDGGDDDDGIVETGSVGNQRMVPVGELNKQRKEAKAAKRQLAEQATAIATVTQQLNEARPYIDRLRANPALMSD